MTSVEGFLHKLERVAKLADPHIVPTYDFGAVEHLLFYVTTFTEGTSLRERLAREQQLPLDDVLRIGVAVASALAHAHGQEVWHGDLRPKHVRLTPHRVMVGSFGLLDALTVGGGSGIGTTAVAIGGPAYQSPELISGTMRDRARSDLYSLGCVLFEMLVGEPPFGRSTQHGAVARKLTEAAPLIRIKRESVPDPLEELVRRCLARVPADRPRSAAEVRSSLEELNAYL
jgi:serine/threonine-protein kinase